MATDSWEHRVWEAGRNVDSYSAYRLTAVVSSRGAVHRIWSARLRDPVCFHVALVKGRVYNFIANTSTARGPEIDRRAASFQKIAQLEKFELSASQRRYVILDSPPCLRISIRE